MPHVRDPRSVARLVETYPRALAAARSHYPYLPRADHEDIVQDAIAKTLARLDRGPIDDPAFYLLRAVLNTGINLLRARRRSGVPLHGADDKGSLVERYADRSLAPLSPPELLLAREEADRAWHVLTQELTAEERLALVRRCIEGRSPTEVAAELGVSVRGYRRLFEQARRRLKDGLDLGAEDGGPSESPTRGDDSRVLPQRAVGESGRAPVGTRAAEHDGGHSVDAAPGVAAVGDAKRRPGDPDLWLAA